ncbi:MAG: hypothetical protein M1837_003123 [Sclerophora amabilis]|nr:MAG: hypothetical protein M1837_003123 [Sclerophora amabilis]
MRVASITALALYVGSSWALPAKPEPLDVCPDATLAEGKSCFPQEGISKRAVCNADNLLRNLRDARYSVSASAFCSDYIRKTVTATIPVTGTATITDTVTPAPVVNTVVDSATVTAVTTTTTTTSVGGPTSVYVAASSAPAKRDVPYPSFLAATYPASRVSSACSCFVTPTAATRSVTVTAGTVTTNVAVSSVGYLTSQALNMLIAIMKTTLPPSTTITTTTTTATVPTTTVATATASQAVLYCNVPGCRNGDYRDEFKGAVSAAECGQQCQNKPSCKSYQYATGYCVLTELTFPQLYNPVNTNPLYVGCLNFRLFERDCPT